MDGELEYTQNVTRIILQLECNPAKNILQGATI